MEEETRPDETRPEEESGDPDRRRFLSRVTIALGAAAGLVAVLPPAAVLLWPVRKEPDERWRAVAKLEDFPIGATRKIVFTDPAPVPWAGFASQSAAWLRREDATEFVAFSIYCTHTACPVRWEPGSELFLCPCHGGAFYRDGSVAAGPPQQPLWRHPVRIRDGLVEIRTIGGPDA